jgi:hypothetical protein
MLTNTPEAEKEDVLILRCDRALERIFSNLEEIRLDFVPALQRGGAPLLSRKI